MRVPWRQRDVNNTSNNPPSSTDALKNRLSRLNEITITVVGRESQGVPSPSPVWFVLEDGKLYLLPVSGSDTQWYKNVLREAVASSASMRAPTRLSSRVVPVTDPAQVASIVEKFRAKHGPSDVKKYYSKFDVAVIADLH